jgi:hypothetical protein
MTNFGLTNRPEIQSKHLIEKDVIHTIANNTNNINNAFNDTFNDNKDFCPIKRHNSVITSNINKFLHINNETTFLTNTNTNANINTNNNIQLLYDEIQRLKKDNRRLLLKNNELSMKLKTQEAKTKINSNLNKTKKLSTQKEEFFLRKIQKLENEIIKQRDLITKLTYNKRFNIGVRKIRVNSILIKGNDSRLKRKNSLNNFYCNNLYKTNFFNKTLPNKSNNQYIKKNSQKIKTNKQDISLHIRPSYSSISSPIDLEKIQKNDYFKNKDLNNTMVIHNKDNSINLKLDRFDITKNIRNNKIITESNKISENQIEEKKTNEQKSINKGFENNFNYKKIGPHKTFGKTSLIMSVINDNLLGIFNLSQYMKECSNKKNTDFQTKLNLKKK